ncbi:MAG: ECF-type sigma factor [Planctomycetota bacterium]
MDQTPDITALLNRVQSGDENAAQELLPHVYEQLRALASSYFRSQSPAHTLQPTALVHEAYVRLVKSPDGAWNDREHFCAVAAIAMRQILRDHARGKNAQKRSASGERVPLDNVESPSGDAPVDLIVLDEALNDLASADESAARLVELRYFGGLSVEQAAEIMGISRTSAVRLWRRGRAWLYARLGSHGAEGGAT